MSSNRSRTRSKIRKRKHDAEMSFISILGEVYPKNGDLTQEIANEIAHETILDIPKELINPSDIQDNLIPGQNEFMKKQSDLDKK